MVANAQTFLFSRVAHVWGFVFRAIGRKGESMSGNTERSLGSRIWRANTGYRLLTNAQNHLHSQYGFSVDAPPVLLIRKLKTEISNERTYLEKLKLRGVGYQFSEAELKA